LRFDATGAWQIDAPADKAAFIRALGALLPAGSWLVLENTTFADEVRVFLESRQPANPPRLRHGTIWPRSRLLHLPATPENLDALARLFETHLVPEVCCHLRAYHENRLLLEWWDVDCDDPCYLASSVDANVLQVFCQRLGCARLLH